MKSRPRREDRSTRTLTPAPQESAKSATKPFSVVGVGASAGGLEAFTKLLKHLPADTGMGFVLVQHLDPAHESALTQLLTRVTSMPVREISNNLQVLPNHVYIIPPNANLAMVRGVLKLHPRQPSARGQRSIDSFFESLAQDQNERAIGVVLSGTASDGTLGLEAIKAEGGITFAQDDSAKYDSMPRGAIAAGCVDFVLSPENIAKELVRIAKHPYVAGQRPTSEVKGGVQDAWKPKVPSGRRSAGAAPTAGENGLKKILLLLRNHTGVEFSMYKSSTIERRIGRRMVLNKLRTLEAYAKFLRGNSKELDALYADVLIGVTGFFRNPLAFEILQRNVFPKLCQARRDEPLRVWSPGCSTGQEAYSIAMSFVEFSDHIPRAPKLQIFATDLNEAVLEKARHGFYSQTQAADVSPERLRRFFVEEQGGYRVSKALREVVVFARQNLLSDPPFSRLDLISCRNLLIYLEPALQRKILPAFHYALRPGGFLFLGASESIGTFTHLFEAMDKTQKIYSKKAGPTPVFRLPISQAPPSVAVRSPAPQLVDKARGEGLAGIHGGLNAQREAERVMLEKYAPAGVLINAEMQVLQFHGSTSQYLEPPTGTASFNVLKMARAGLMLPLRAAIAKARKENKVVRREGVPVNQNDRTRTVNLEVIPLKNLKDRCFLVLFEKERGSREPGPREAEAVSGGGQSASRVAGDSRAPTRRIAELERELAETRDYLQALQEQQAASNEELQASNEEAQSANEELQSINEELETSKEELESTNEELTTVNDEMGNRNLELNRLNSDLNNLQVNVHTAVLLLGRDLTIRRFTPLAQSAFNLQANDVGRPLSHIKYQLVFPQYGDTPGLPLEPRSTPGHHSADSSLDLEALVREAIDTVSPREREVRDKDGRWYSLRVRPYMTLDNKIDGAVLVLVDIDALKRSGQEVKAARDYAEGILRSARDPVVILRPDLCVDTANEAFYKTFQVTPDQTEGRSLFALADGAWQIPKLRKLLEDILPRNSFFNDFEVAQDFPGIGRRLLLLDARPVKALEGADRLILLGIEDMTELRASEAAAKLAAIVQSTDDAIWTRSLDGIITSWNPGAERMLGYTAQEIVGRNASELTPPGRAEEWDWIQEKFRRGEHITHLETERMRKDGSLAQVSVSISPMRDRLGELTGAAAIARDITELKQAEAALRESEERLRGVVETAVDGIITIDERGVVATMNPAAERIFGYAASEVVGQNLKMLMPEPYRAEHDSYLSNYLETGQRKIIGIGREVQGRRKDGTTFPLDLAVSEMQLGGRRAFTGVVRDITKRKEAEKTLAQAQEELLQHSGALEVQVGERTARLTEMVGELEAFSYSITHDMRAPLRAMQGFAELLAGECSPQVSAQGKEYIRLITSATRRMDRLIQDALNYSLIARTALNLEPVPLELFLRGILESYPALQRPAAEIELEGEFPAVLANEAALTQCVSNLLGNAIKFVAAGMTPRVRVWAKVRDGRVRLFFEDNGIGIEADQQEKIFGIFQRLNKEYEGTGIGLAIVKKAAERMGGQVGVQSEPGKGSTFWLELPAGPLDTI